jgi:hypothetical protein
MIKDLMYIYYLEDKCVGRDGTVRFPPFLCVVSIPHLFLKFQKIWDHLEKKFPKKRLGFAGFRSAES